MSTLILFTVLSLAFSVVLADAIVDSLFSWLFHSESLRKSGHSSSESHGVCGNCMAACASSSQGSRGKDGGA